MDKIAHHIKVRRKQKLYYVDSAGFKQKGICLTGGYPAEMREVSRGHSSYRQRAKPSVPGNLEVSLLKNKGSAGVDGMRLTELTTYVEKHRDEIAMALYNGDYKVQPILGVEIPKSNVKIRLLGIPTVIDRWLQQCVTQAITLKFELEFKEHSYGFRPNKNSHQCIQQSQKYIHEGYQHIVDIDLKNFFDEVDHSLLLQLLYNKVKCPITLRLIRKWLRAPILIKGKLISSSNVEKACHRAVL